MAHLEMNLNLNRRDYRMANQKGRIVCTIPTMRYSGREQR